MNQVPDLNFSDEKEFRDYLVRLQRDNSSWDISEIMDMLNNNWATIWWQSIWEYSDNNEWWAEDVSQYAKNKSKEASSFMEEARLSSWQDKTWQEKAEILAEKYNSILNKAKEKAKQTYWLAWEWLKRANEELDWYREQLKAIEQSPEFEQLMKDLAERGTWKMFDNWIINSNVNQTLKMIASWKWSQLFASWDRLKNWADAIETSWIWKFANEYSETPWRQWPAWSIFWWEDAQDIAKAYLEEKAKNNRTNKSSNTKEDKRNKTKEKSSLNLNPDNESPLNWEEESKKVTKRNNETKNNKEANKNSNKGENKKNSKETRVAQSSPTITNLLKRKA